ncbi:3-hydroxyisobutyryl-CoA hydrolase-like protein [Musa troglodytarum]|uniref:3-hydroxyisobutyryl-CoA hydrolase n=1 Tax=Musa troglodytarum TaxID=320322 RepID=A0A9E7GTW6_9LILI|nr:3-hydroxyisobutyryl-CoA hydrolase-like protein [Musa troglodytarum]
MRVCCARVASHNYLLASMRTLLPGLHLRPKPSSSHLHNYAIPCSPKSLSGKPNLTRFVRLWSLNSRRYVATMADDSEDFVKGSVVPNGVDVITLNRPKALNAMNLEMDLKYHNFLDEWGINPSIKCVLVESSSPRAFSAGGDVKQITTKYKMSEIIEV